MESADRKAHPVTFEMTADGRFARRIVRLGLTSVFALGLIWFLSVVTLDAGPAIRIGLIGGWFLMPSFLGLSLRWPVLRRLLIVPSSLVSLALLAICLSAIPEGVVAHAGWLLITAGVLFGGTLGVWFWFRWLPVPARLADPFSAGRWALIGIHVSLTVAGLFLVGLSALD